MSHQSSFENALMKRHVVVQYQYQIIMIGALGVAGYLAHKPIKALTGLKPIIMPSSEQVSISKRTDEDLQYNYA